VAAWWPFILQEIIWLSVVLVAVVIKNVLAPLVLQLRESAVADRVKAVTAAMQGSTAAMGSAKLTHVFLLRGLAVYTMQLMIAIFLIAMPRSPIVWQHLLLLLLILITVDVVAKRM
tara:strand:- start:2053 stop:2400 length:348 start_codon:yes stop_codon:yes gene_type:complete